MRTRRPLSVLPAALLVLAGCAVPVHGTGNYNANELERLENQRNSAPISSTLALGPVRQVNYCSLVDPGSIPGAGAVRPQSSFDACTLKVKVAGVDVDVYTGYLSTDTISSSVKPIEGKTLPRGLVAEQSNYPGSGDCSRYLRFTDDVRLSINATSYTTGNTSGKMVPEDKLCVLASGMLDSVTNAIVGRRTTHVEFPQRSLGNVAACDLLNAGLVGAQLGRTVTQQEYPGAHRCRWGSPGTPSASLSFSIDSPISPGDGVTEEQIGGRATQVQKTGSTGFCVLQTKHLPQLDGSGLTELAVLFITAKDIGKDPCVVGRALAAQAWPKLPVL